MAFHRRDAVLVAMLTCIIVPALLYKPHREDCLDVTLGRSNFDVYLINLEDDTNRLQSFKHAFKQSDLSKTHSLIRYAAADGRSLDIQSLVTPKALKEIQQAEKVKYRAKHYELTRGAVGCWLSHVRLWRDFLETDKEAALIFEDDCVMVTDIESRLADIRPPKDWDIALLGYICNRCTNQSCGDMIRVNRFFGMHCYMVNRRFVRKFFASPYSKQIGKQIDSVLSDMITDGTINVYASRKKVAWQNNRHGTTIQMPIRMVEGVDVWARD